MPRALFKVEQAWPTGLRHYLSHYQASQSHASDCELRVDRLGDVERDRVNSLSRGQKRALFLEVLQSATIRTVWGGGDNRKPVRRAIRDIQEKGHIAFLRTVTFDKLDARNFVGEFDGMVENYYSDAGVPHTAFAEGVQRRIARDMLVHIFSAKARRSYDFLFNSSLLHLIARMDAAKEAGKATVSGEKLYRYAAGLISSPEAQGKDLLAEALHEVAHPPFVETPIPYLGQTNSRDPSRDDRHVTQIAVFRNPARERCEVDLSRRREAGSSGSL